MGTVNTESVFLEKSAQGGRKIGLRLEALPLFFFGALFCFYAYLTWSGLSEWWFDPRWTTDDALQQSYPFHAVYHPEIFRGDLITELMRGYLPPLHYGLSYLITIFTANPIMTGHWVMLIQIILTLIFSFLAVRHMTGSAAAGFFALTWFLHTRHVFQRITGGLPRGWGTAIIAAFFYFLLRKNHRAVLLVLLAGFMLNPPLTLIPAMTYGIWLLAGFFKPESRAEFRRPLLEAVLLAPICLAVILWVVHRPESIGPMADFATASAMPEFSRSGGRFGFLPFRSPLDEFWQYGFQPFISKFFEPIWPLKAALPFVALSSLAALFFVERRTARKVVPRELLLFLGCIVVIYFASRQFAFKLYVPDRHLQMPMTMFWLLALTIGLWLSCTGLFRYLAVALLSLFVVLGSGSGLYGPANFNTNIRSRGGAFSWIKASTPEDSLIAGQPTHLDHVQLVGMRKGFATTEAAHPFYANYYNEVKRRLIVTWKAHYATDFSEFLGLLEPEGVDYFVFRHKDFGPEGLAKATYFRPLDQMVSELARKPVAEYVYSKLLALPADPNYPIISFRDKISLVVDIAKLRAYVDAHSRKKL